MFSLIRDGLTLFGITMVFLCKPNLSKTYMQKRNKCFIFFRTHYQRHFGVKYKERERERGGGRGVVGLKKEKERMCIGFG